MAGHIAMMESQQPNSAKVNIGFHYGQIKYKPNREQMIPTNTSQSPQELRSKLSHQLPQQIYQVLYSYNHFVCAGPAQIYVYSAQSKTKTTIKICTTDFTLVNFPPFLFACLITQFIYFYNEEALHDVTKIVKMKISKMNVRCIEPYNKGYFMGGYNRSPYPGGNLIDKRTIYYLENLSSQQKNKPIWEISIPKNSNPISIIHFQNPYLMCYCDPNVYVVNPFTKNILISFQKQFLNVLLLQGRYAVNCVNMLGVSLKDKSIISVDVQRFPIFGVELNEFPEKAISVSQAKDGVVYGAWKNEIFIYNLFKKERKIVKTLQKSCQILEIFCTPKNILVVLYRTDSNEEELTNETGDNDRNVNEMELGNSIVVEAPKLESFEKNQETERRYIEAYVLEE